MSNNLQNNPVLIDTAMTQSFKTALYGAAETRPLTTLLVAVIRWRNPGASHNLVISDEHGNTLWSTNSNANGDDVVEDLNTRPRAWRDFIVNAIVGGQLELTLR